MRAYSPPHFIPANAPGASLKPPIVLPSYDERAIFSEDHLQRLIFENPTLLPVSSFEPYFKDVIPLCRELPTPAGPLDNLYVTPEGDLILVECKLWKNPEARRKVIAQIMDYAKEIANWSYDDLTRAVNSANRTNEDNPVYALASQHPDSPEEAVFVDQVSRNLCLGRHLLLIVGDGIQEGAERLTNFLQQNMGLQFTLGLLEMGIYQLPDNAGLIVVPKIIAKTTIIERGIIRIENGVAKSIEPPTPSYLTNNKRAENLSEIQFFEALKKHDAGAAIWLKEFLSKIEKLEITWEVKQSLLPRYCPDGETDYGLGYFKTDGNFLTHNAVFNLDGTPLKFYAEQYIKNIAQLFEGAEIRNDKIRLNGKVININDLIGKEDALLKIISMYLNQINDAIKNQI